MLILQDRDKYDKDIWTARRYSGESKRNVGIVEVSESELSKMKRIYAEGGEVERQIEQMKTSVKRKKKLRLEKELEKAQFNGNVKKIDSILKQLSELDSTYAEGGEIEIEFEHKGNKHKHSFTPEEEDWWTSFESNGNSYDVHYDEDYGTISVYEYSDKGTDYANTVYSKKIMVKGGEVEMMEIDEDGINVPPQLMDIFSEFNEDEDYYKEMERLKVKANKIGYDFDYGLDGTPTEFCEIPKKSWGGGIAIGTAVGGYVGYKIGRARTQKKGFETEKKIGRGIKKTFSKKK